jgi:hypothetical protein
MNRLLLISLCISASQAFTLPRTKTTSSFLVKSTTQENVPFFLKDEESQQPKSHNEAVATIEKEDPSTVVSTIQNEVIPPSTKTTPKPVASVSKPKARKVKKPNHKEGVFSPIVFASKKLVGDDKINKLRSKVISLHSGVIGNFVDTHTTVVGEKISQSLFVIMDANNDGSLDEKELKAAFEALGFTWLKEKQVGGILKRADADKNGVIDYDEFKNELSKTLRVNLIKLAKKNGEEMGLLV